MVGIEYWFMKNSRSKLAARKIVVAAVMAAGVVAATHTASAANKKPVVHHPPAKKAAPMHHAPAQPQAAAKKADAQTLAQQQAAEQAKKQADAAQANGGAAAPLARPVAPVTPQDPAKLVGVAQAPVQGDLDKKLVGVWTVSSTGAALGILKIAASGEYVWKTDDAESKGKLLQVVPRRDSKTGVTYWKLKDDKQQFYAFISPDSPGKLSLNAVDTNAAVAEGVLKDSAKATDAPAAASETTEKSAKS